MTLRWLTVLMSSRTRAEILRHLFGFDQGELHLRELARRSGLNPTTVRQDLAKLRSLDLVLSRRDGNRVYYRANPAHPCYIDIRGLVVKSTGLIEVLRRRLDTDDVQIAFVFGSVAGGTPGPESDIDLCVIGAVNLRGISKRLEGIEEELGREVNPYCLTPTEYRRRVRSGDHFLGSVLGSRRMFVRGGEDELKALG